MINDLLIHTCDISTPTSSNTLGALGEITRQYALTPTSVGNKCLFDYKSPTNFVGMQPDKIQESNQEIPILILPFILDGGYKPTNNDIVTRTDSADPQFLNQCYRIVTVRNGRNHHWEADLELIQGEA